MHRVGCYRSRNFFPLVSQTPSEVLATQRPSNFVTSTNSLWTALAILTLLVGAIVFPRWAVPFSVVAFILVWRISAVIGVFLVRNSVLVFAAITVLLLIAYESA